MAPRDEWDEADARGEAAPHSGFTRSADGIWHQVARGNKTKHAAIREQLLTRATQLGLELATIDRLTGPPADGARPQYGKRIGDHTGDAVEMRRNVAAGDVLRDLQGSVEQALRKLDAATYGVCELCGNVISEDRLAALPWAATCVECPTKTVPGSEEQRRRSSKGSNP